MDAQAKIKEIAGVACNVENVDINGVTCTRVTLADKPQISVWQNFSAKAADTGLQPIFVLEEEGEIKPTWDIGEQYSVLQDSYSKSEASQPKATTPLPTNPFANFAGMANAIDNNAITKAVDSLTHPDNPLSGAMAKISKDFGIDLKQTASLLNTEALKGVFQTHFESMANMYDGMPGQMQAVRNIQALEFMPLRKVSGEKDTPSVEDFIEAANSMDLQAWLKARNTPAPPIGASTKLPQIDEPQISQTLMLIPVKEAWQIPAVLRLGGIDDNPWPHVHAAIWKRWNESYKCLPLSIGQDIAFLYLEKPVTEDALFAAKDMAAYSPYHLRGDFGDGTISGVAANLNGAQTWACFWG